MHISCSNTLPLPTPADSAASRAKFDAFSQQFEALIAAATPEALAQPGTFLVCDTDEEAGYMRLLLDRRGLTHIEARVKLKLPARKRARQNRQARQQAGYKARR